MGFQSTIYVAAEDVSDQIADRVLKMTERLCPLLIDLVDGGASIRAQVAPPLIYETLMRKAELVDYQALYTEKWLDEVLKERGEPDSKILVLCSQNHQLAKSVRFNAPHAVWGGACPEKTLAIVYGSLGADDAIWHEILHLYGAEDCYDTVTQLSTCSTSDCIMRYGVLSSCGGKKLVLCEDNASRLKLHIRGLDRG